MRLPLTQAFEIFGLLRKLSDECRLKLSAVGWEITITNGWEALELSIPPAAFRHFGYIGTTKQIGVDIKKLYTMLDYYERWYRIFQPDAPIPDVAFTFRWDENKTYNGTNEPICYLEVIIGDIIIVETFETPYYDSIRAIERIPKLNPSATATILNEQLLQAMGRGKEIAEHGTLIARNNETRAPADEEFDYCFLDLEVTINHQNLKYQFGLFNPVTEIKEQEVRSTYKLKSIWNIVNSLYNCETVLLQFSTDYPLRISFRICDGKAAGSYYLSPKIEEGN